MLPVGMWDGETLVAAFAVQSAAPMAGWTLEERQASIDRTGVSLLNAAPELVGVVVGTVWLSGGGVVWGAGAAEARGGLGLVGGETPSPGGRNEATSGLALFVASASAILIR
ncbi:hypothetical protein ACFVYT_41750 [Streptomyces sp. NPDC058290]|uniref:hypothetical protein n=1 Tax=Streptomyces sp. NPDC058290 TaxID=3346426 RepID=UPI0036E2224F